MTACEGTNSSVAPLARRGMVLVEEAMTPAAKCRRMAAMLRAKADGESDPEARAEWKCIARGYLILATQFEQSGAKDIILPTIREIDEQVI